MKEAVAIVFYSVIFLILSIAGAGLLFLFALPFSLLLLVGVIIWGLAELVRYMWHGPVTSVPEMRLVPSRRIKGPATLDLRAQLAGQRTHGFEPRHRLQFVPHARRHGMRGRMTALSMRHPHHAHAHSS